MGTGLKDPLNIQEQDLCVLIGNCVDHQPFSGNAGVSFRKDLSGTYMSQNAPVAPDVVVFNGNTAGQDHADRISGFSCPENVRSFGKTSGPPVQTLEHGGKFLLTGAMKKHCVC